ncbi:hypothetical protein HKBW3S42_02335, partial [Candidatus Hakubella thermalkaliphila]
MITREQWTLIFPNLKDPWRSQVLPFLEKAMEEFYINTPKRMSQFLAKLA